MMSRAATRLLDPLHHHAALSVGHNTHHADSAPDIADTRGQCQNGGCPRLATVIVRISRLGDRHLCWLCHQALEPLMGYEVKRLPIPAPLPTRGAPVPA